MRPKLTAWLLATLVVLCAGVTVPVSARTINQSSYAIVLLVGVSDRSTSTAQTQQWTQQRLPSVFSTLDDSGRTLAGINLTLLQRPPPGFLLSSRLTATKPANKKKRRGHAPTFEGSFYAFAS